MKIFLKFDGAESLILNLLDGESAEEVAKSFQITNPDNYLAFDDSDYDEESYFFPGAYTLSGGVLTFDLEEAKTRAIAYLNSRFQESIDTALVDVNKLIFIAQSSLPEVDRIPKYQTAINAVNTIATSIASLETTINNSTTIAQVKTAAFD